MGGSSSSASTSNISTTNNFGNYGDGLIVHGDSNEVNYLSKDVAITAIEEAGMFAETASHMSLEMMQSNSDLVESTMEKLSGKTDGSMKLITFISVATIASVLIIGARK